MSEHNVNYLLFLIGNFRPIVQRWEMGSVGQVSFHQ
jgi:hypothetical protein